MQQFTENTLNIITQNMEPFVKAFQEAWMPIRRFLRRMMSWHKRCVRNATPRRRNYTPSQRRKASYALAMIRAHNAKPLFSVK